MASEVTSGLPSPLTRLEAFSDGVFAIAMTLLIIEIEVPSIGLESSPTELWHELASLWPSYLAFVLSFGTILVMWVNHHHAIRLLTGTSNPFLYANGLLLLTVVFMPYPTALFARYFATESASAAVVFYAGASALTSAAFLVWFVAMQKPVFLLRTEIGADRISKIWKQSWSGLLAYLVATLIAWWWPIAGLVVMVALFFLWIGMSVAHGSGLVNPPASDPGEV